MKKYALGIAGTLGTISAILTLIGELPQYEKVLLVLIGISVGFFLGSYSHENASKSEPMSDKTKCFLFTIVIFVAPVALLMFFITLIWALGLVNIVDINTVLGFSVFILVVIYITAGIVVSGWKEKYNQSN